MVLEKVIFLNVYISITHVCIVRNDRYANDCLLTISLKFDNVGCLLSGKYDASFSAYK